MNDTIHILENGGFETESFRTKQEELDKNLAVIHFLNTAKGKDWINIEKWKKTQKANKTKK